MEPRLRTSKKWTAFPAEYLTQIQQVFMDGFQAQLKEAKLVIDGRIYPEEILLRVGFVEKGRLAQINFDVSMNYSTKQKDTVDRIHDCIDAAGSMMAEYFEKDGEVDFPLVWKEYDFNEKKLFLRNSTENSELEAQANALLGIEEEALVKGVDDIGEVEDALDRAEETVEAESLEDDSFEDDADDDEDDDEIPSGPTMFSGKKKKKDDLH